MSTVVVVIVPTPTIMALPLPLALPPSIATPSSFLLLVLLLLTELRLLLLSLCPSHVSMCFWYHPPLLDMYAFPHLGHINCGTISTSISSTFSSFLFTSL